MRSLCFTSSVVNHHTHDVQLHEADFARTGSATFVTTRAHGHTHHVTLSPCNLHGIRDGRTEDAETSRDAGHTHAFHFVGEDEARVEAHREAEDADAMAERERYGNPRPRHDNPAVGNVYLGRRFRKDEDPQSAEMLAEIDRARVKREAELRHLPRRLSAFGEVEEDVPPPRALEGYSGDGGPYLFTPRRTWKHGLETLYLDSNGHWWFRTANTAPNEMGPSEVADWGEEKGESDVARELRKTWPGWRDPEEETRRVGNPAHRETTFDRLPVGAHFVYVGRSNVVHQGPYEKVSAHRFRDLRPYLDEEGRAPRVMLVRTVDVREVEKRHPNPATKQREDDVVIKGDEVSFLLVGDGAPDDREIKAYKTRRAFGPGKRDYLTDTVMVHDPSGRSFRKCDIYIVKRLSGNSGAKPCAVEIDSDTKNYYPGAQIDCGVGLEKPTGPWQRVGQIDGIRYRRWWDERGDGHYKLVPFEHPFDPHVTLYQSGSSFRLRLPEDCILDERGFVHP